MPAKGSPVPLLLGGAGEWRAGFRRRSRWKARRGGGAPNTDSYRRPLTHSSWVSIRGGCYEPRDEAPGNAVEQAVGYRLPTGAIKAGSRVAIAVSELV
jgi:hypothetical protein